MPEKYVDVYDQLNDIYAVSMPYDVSAAIYDWVGGSKLGSSSLKLLKEFYYAIGPQHSDRVEYYRGLQISLLGFINLLEDRKLKLKSRPSESWSCNRDVAYNIVRDFGRQKDNAGIVLYRTIPHNKLVADLQEIYNYYQPWMDEENDEILDSAGREAVQRIAEYNECELLTETVCTSCSIDEIDGIMFIYQSDIQEELEHFLSGFKNVDSSIKKFIKLSQFDITGSLNKKFITLMKNESEKWEIRTDSREFYWEY